MTDKFHPDQTNASSGSSSRQPAKKPYLKPAFRHEKVFETMALACGKLNGTQATCRANRRNS
jgi:hypothetical protein